MKIRAKKFLSVLLSAIMAFGVIPSATYVSTYASSSYEAELLAAGFTDDYIDALVELHEKYPNWTFEALEVGMTLEEAVAEERTPHSQQLIQKTTSNSSKGYYCTCSSCYVNGSYVIQEGSTWVSASESAVEYYMNPLNFLTEEYIFQFESNEYDSSQTQSGVETILDGTWMEDSYIKYYNTSGSYVTYTNSSGNKMKYSKVIMNAAKAFELSAYYLASKIVQEVGGTTASAGGACGTNSTYPGIYNYYNINATSSYLDGLKWASGSYTTNCSCNVRKSASTSSTKLVTLPSGTSLTYISSTSGSDGYTWYKISVTYSGTTYTGYIRSDLVDSGTSYGRPWITPYRTIYYGAKWIAANYSSTQCTGYLQKFNVNPASSNQFSHEYMANVQAAASEALTTYSAYEEAGILSTAKTFLIPVYEDVDVDDVENLTTSSVKGITAKVTWDSVSNADGYKLQIKASGDSSWTTVGTTTSTSYSLTDLSFGTKYSVRMKAWHSYGGTKYWSSSWTSVSFTTLSVSEMEDSMSQVSSITKTKGGNDCLVISYSTQSGITGYQIQTKTSSSGSWTTAKKSTSGTATLTGLSAGKTYYIRIRAYAKDSSSTAYGTWSSTVTLKTSSSGSYTWTVSSSKPVKKCSVCGTKVLTLKFTDISSSTYKGYYNYIAYTSYFNSFIKGTSSTTYAPTKAVTKAALITILYRMAGSPSVSGYSNPYKDVKSTAYYYKAALWAYKKGITTDTTFGGANAISREKAVTYLYRYAKKYTDADMTTKSISSFPDASSVKDYAVTAMKWAYKNGLITGNSAGKLNPQGTTYRIYFSKILYKFGVACDIGNFS